MLRMYKLLYNIVDITLPSYIIPSTGLTKVAIKEFTLP